MPVSRMALPPVPSSRVVLDSFPRMMESTLTEWNIKISRFKMDGGCYLDGVESEAYVRDVSDMAIDAQPWIGTTNGESAV